MLSIEDQIKEILRLSELYENNIDSLDKLREVDRGLGTDFWDIRTRDYWMTNFGKNALGNLLNETDSEALKRIVSVLYSGRSKVSNSNVLNAINFYDKEQISKWHKEALINKIMELTHSARKNYLSHGLEICHQEEINLDELAW